MPETVISGFFRSALTKNQYTTVANGSNFVSFNTFLAGKFP